MFHFSNYQELNVKVDTEEKLPHNQKYVGRKDVAMHKYYKVMNTFLFLPQCGCFCCSEGWGPCRARCQWRRGCPQRSWFPRSALVWRTFPSGCSKTPWNRPRCSLFQILIMIAMQRWETLSKADNYPSRHHQADPWHPPP